MKKKDKKNILASSIKYFYTVGFIVNIGTLLVATIIFLIILFTDKSNIINYYETLINSASMSENLTWFFYLIMCIVNIMIIYVLYLISLVLGIMGYKLKNRILKTISVVLNAIAILLTLFLSPIVSYFLIPLFVGFGSLIFGLYLETKELEKNKKNI